MDEELFRFVAVRDAQRTPRPKALRVPTWTPDAESPLVTALRAASPDRAGIVATAEDFRESRAFTGSMDAAPPLIRAMDTLLLEGAAPSEVVHAVEVNLRDMAGGSTADLEDLLAHPEVEAARQNGRDSYLASLFSLTAPEQERSWLDRVVTLWAVTAELVMRRTVTAPALADLVASAVVFLPDGIEIDPAPGAEGRRAVRGGADVAAGAERTAAGDPDVVPPTLQRYLDLRDTYAAARQAVIDVLATIADDTAATDAANLSSAILAGRLVDPVVLTTLEVEGIRLDATPLVELPDLLMARANAALAEHFAALGTAPAEARRSAVVAEIARRRGAATLPGGTVVTARAPGIGRLISAPAVGDLKVVRQTLAGYELGEIAHVENLLAKEHIGREHEIVDLTETESVTVDTTQETHVRDLQTTTRSELSRETASVVASTDAFNIGGTITASYGPYVSVSATAGYAASNSRTESEATSQRFSRDVTERATDNIMTRSESFRRALNRRTVTEKNTHELTGPNTGNASAVYRWVNKRYCAQVFDYGRRVLLEIGIPDPAVHYRWAAASAGDLDVAVDPPPSLTAPLGGELSPSSIDETNWQALSARFRVAEFPPPPRYLVTTPDAFGIEPPAAPTSEGATPQPIAVFKASKELKIPAGYQPLCFFAGVLADGAPLRLRRLPQLDRSLIETLIVGRYANGYLDVPVADVVATARIWLDWVPDAVLPMMTTRDVAVLHGTALTVVFEQVKGGNVAARPWLTSLRGFLAAVTGRGAVTLVVGTTSVTVEGGSTRTGGVVTAPQVIAGVGDVVLPVGYATEPGVAGAVITLEVLSTAGAALRGRWQLEAYNAVLAAHASWEADFRAAVAQAEIQSGVTIEGRNPLENAGIVTAEIKRAVIAMLGGVTDGDLDVVQPGTTEDDPMTGRPTPPRVDLEHAPAAVRLVQFYEQAFEWQNMSHVLYPYFWTGRDDWPEALRRQDPDPQFRDFLRAGAARVILPVRRGWERLVGSRLSLTIPAWPKVPVPSTTPLRSGDPFLDITEEIREAQDMQSGGRPAGAPWPVVLPTTLVAFDGTPMPTYPTALDPPPP